MEILFYSALFSPPKSITCSFDFLVGGNFRQARKANEATSEINEDTDMRSPIGPYFQLNSPINLARIDLLLIQVTVRDRVTSWKNIRGSRDVN